MRKIDIEEQIKYVTGLIIEIRSLYVKTLNDPSTNELYKPTVMTCLNSLRSCLDYAAKDIYEYLVENFPDTKYINQIHFPYAENESKFDKYANDKLPGLKTNSPEIYRIIMEQQSFSAKTNWLNDLCDLTNASKHDELPKQDRKDNVEVNIGSGGIVISGSNNIVINSTVGHTHVHYLSTKDGRVDTLITNKEADISIINWTNFTFKDTNINVLNFLSHSLKQVKKLKNKIYRIIEQ